MGIYLNPGSGKFEEALNSEIYVDKSGLIAYTNKVFGTKQICLCQQTASLWKIDGGRDAFGVL